jgi:hypothetical protein
MPTCKNGGERQSFDRNVVKTCERTARPKVPISVAMEKGERTSNHSTDETINKIILLVKNWIP